MFMDKLKFEEIKRKASERREKWKEKFRKTPDKSEEPDKSKIIQLKDKLSGRKFQKPTGRTAVKLRIVFGAIGVLLCLYLIVSVHYLFHFRDNTYLNGVNVSRMSVGQAEKALEKAGPDYELTITGAGDVREVLKDSKLDFSIKNKKDIRTALRSQNAFAWPVSGSRTDLETNISVSYDEDRLAEDMSELSILQEDNMVEPVNAAVTAKKDGTAKISTEVVGSKFNVSAAKEIIKNAVDGYKNTVSIKASQSLPNVYSSDKTLTKRKEQWNRYLKAAGISYKFPTATVKLNKQEIGDLLVDDGKQVTVSSTKLASLMSQWKSRYDTVSNYFYFKTHSGKKVRTISLGDYGYALNEEKTGTDLKDHIEKGEHGSYSPKWTQKGNGYANSGLGDSYVEISITNQHVWVYKDGKCVVETDVVTGNPKPDSKGRNRQTYKGVFSIKNKVKDKVLGKLDREGYESPVDYWLPFNGGEGLHDAPWRSNFGGSIYLTNGSHGCVNCPSWIMHKIFSNVEIGEAVIVY